MRRLNGLVIKRKMVPMMLWTLELSLLGKMVQSQPKDKTLMVSGRSMETLISVALMSIKNTMLSSRKFMPMRPYLTKERPIANLQRYLDALEATKKMSL